MSTGFTPEQRSELAELIRESFAALMPEKLVTDPTPAIVSDRIIADVNTPLSFDAVAPKARREVTAEMLAADATDPERNAYTGQARKYDRETYVALWTAERNRLLAAGVPKSMAGKQAQANYDALLRAEKARLKNRDASTAAPLMGAKSSRLVRSVSDPTGNTAASNVDRAARLRAELAALESGDMDAYQDIRKANDLIAAMDAGLPVKERKAASERSIAQKAVGANPFQRVIDKLVADAKASGNAKSFVSKWFADGCAKSPSRKAVLAKQAVLACTALGIPVRG